MANMISTFKKYVDKLDAVYQQSAATAILESDPETVKMGSKAGEFLIPKMSMDGLADYSRGDGYVTGGVSLDYETKACNYDRGRRLNVDAMDNEETAGIAFGKLASEFIRTKVVPEMDAFRFALYAGTKGIFSASGELSNGEAVLTALQAAVNAQDEAEVNTTGKILFITPTLLTFAKNVDTTKSKAILDRFEQIVTVPQPRFYTAISLLGGKKDDELAGGFKPLSAGYVLTADTDVSAGKTYYTKSEDVYTKVGSPEKSAISTYYEKTAGAHKLNFMVINRDAVIQFGKHTVNKVITPEVNQTSDSYMFFYRAYGIAETYENKVKGIYMHYDPTEIGG